MSTNRNESLDCRSSYDCVAREYTNRIADELQHKPLGRESLDRFSERLRAAGPVCDIGCGPGHVTRYLHDRGVQVSGVDLSFEMVRTAREMNPGIDFQQGNMLSLDVPDGTWAGISAFYSIIHIPRGAGAGSPRGAAKSPSAWRAAVDRIPYR